MPIDYKKIEKDLYQPKTTPSIINAPEMTFITVDGKGDPNTSAEYTAAVELLYGFSYTIKMGNKSILEYEFKTITEGLCVQVMHIGSYDDEPATIAALDGFAIENGYIIDIDDTRRHHEIYISDPRKVAPEKLKTVLRHPIRSA